MALSEAQLQRFETLKAVFHYFYRDNTRSGSHCRHTIKYHFVWIPKYRREVLVGRIPAMLKEILHEIARNYKLKIIALEVMPDTVHLYISTEPTDRPDDVVKWLKLQSSKLMGRKYPYLKNKKGEVWGRGYFITAVNDKTTSEQIKRYIRNQKTVAAQGTLF